MFWGTICSSERLEADIAPLTIIFGENFTFDPATPTLDLPLSMELRLGMVGTDIYLRIRGLTMVGACIGLNTVRY